MDEFVREVNDILADTDLSIIYKKIWKNNVLLDAFVLKGRSISPTMYVDESILSEDPLKVANDIIAFMNEHSMDLDVDLSLISNWDYIKEHVYPKVISDCNIENLIENDICYDTFLDMAVVYYVVLPNTGNNMTSSYTIHNSHIDTLDISKGQLRYTANRNCEKDFEVLSIDSLIPFISEEEALFAPMYVLTNERRLNGAGIIVNDNILSDISERLDDDLIILPSSVHEVIIVPIGPFKNYNELKAMVCEVNSTMVDDLDKLTDSVYIYDGALRRLA